MAAEADQKGLRKLPLPVLCLASCYPFSSPCPLSCADLYAVCYEIAVVVHVRATGDAPILKQSKFKVRVPSSRGPIICFSLQFVICLLPV